VEQGSVIRRVYLLLLFGVVGVTAVIVLLTSAYLLFFDLFQNGINSSTANKVRFPVSIFLTAVVISKYHWDIYKKEKDVKVFQPKSIENDERLYFFVELKLKPDSATKVIDVLNKYTAHVRKEKGCDQLDVLFDPKEKNTVYLYEIWSNSESHKAHLSSEGFLEWKAYSDPLITGFEVKQLTNQPI
jgi:quinol monooxygenase YgiN